MNFSVYSYSPVAAQTYKYNNNRSYKSIIQKNAQNHINFEGLNPHEKKTPKNNPLRALATIGVCTAFTIGGINTCSSDSNRYSGTDYRNEIEIEYTDVSKENRDSVMTPVFNLYAKLTPKNNFLAGTKFDIASSFANLADDDIFKEYLLQTKSDSYTKGVSFYSDKKLRKRVAIQENAHNRELSIHNYMEMRQTVMHEVGHLFDNYFGHNHNAEFAQKWDSLMAVKELPYCFETVSEKDKKLDVQYNYNNSLSDKTKFQEAVLADLKNIARMRRRYDAMPQNLDDYIGHFDLYSGLTPENIESENGARAEIYAELFSYALGEDDGDKELFINCFPNSYEIVQADIKKYLNIKCK